MEDCSPEWLASAQLVASIAGQNIDDRNRAFIEKSEAFLRFTARILAFKRAYNVPDSELESQLEDMWDLMICIGNSRVDDPDLPPEDVDLS